MTLRTVISGALLLASSMFSLQVHAQTVAIVQSLTGPAAFVGVGARDGMMLGLDELAASGKLGTLKLTPVVADDATDRGQSIALATRYAQDPAVLIELGPTTGTIAGAVSQVANQYKMPMYTVTNLVAALDAGPWSFIHAQPAATAVPGAVDFALNKVNVKSCAFAELVDNPAFVQQRKMFEEAIRAKGVETQATVGFKLADTDFSATAVKIVSQKPDCIYLALPPVHAANFIAQLRQSGLDPKTKLIGTTGLASDDLIKIGGPAVEGVYVQSDWIPGGSNNAGRAFAKAFQAKYGRAPDTWAAHGYSMVLVLASALKAAGANPTRDSLRDALAKTKDVDVIVGSGKFSYGADRIPNYGNDFTVVKNGAFTPYTN